MKSEKIKKLVVKSESAAVEFKRARGGVPADFWPPYSAEKTYNHPSGDLAPSKGDLDLPCRLAELSEIAQIRHLDHLSVTTPSEPSKSYYFIRELHQEMVGGELVNKKYDLKIRNQFTKGINHAIV